MKRVVLIFIAVAFQSCIDKNCDQEISGYKSKIDSLETRLKDFEDDTVFRFYSLLKKETNTDNDTILIEDYKDLLGKEKLIDPYIWDRMASISNISTNRKLLKKFEGEYTLKPIHSGNQNDIKIIFIKIEKDSCYLLSMDKTVLKADRLKIVNSSAEGIYGMQIIDDFKITFIYPNQMLVSSLNCMDCKPWGYQLK